MKIIIALIVVILVSGSSYPQNINAPNIHGPEGLKVNSFSCRLFYKRADLIIPCRGLNIDITFYYNTGTTAIDLGYGGGWSMTYSMLYEYETASRIEIRYETGRKEKFNFNGSKWVAPTGNFDSLFQYQPGKFQLREKSGTTYFFDDSTHKKLTKITDRNNNAITISYSSGYPSAITDPSGRSVNLNFNSGHLTSITDPNSSPARVIQYSYDSNFNPISVTDPAGYVIHYEFDGLKRMTKLIDQSAYQYYIIYNGIGHDTRVSQIKSPLNILNFYINSYDFVTSVTEMVNNVVTTTSYKYQSFLSNNLTEKSGSCCGFNESYEYDLQKNLVKKTDANSNEWLYTYDSKGNRTIEKDPLLGEINYVYDPVYSQVTSKKDKRGIITNYIYDSQGNLLHENKPLGVSEHYTYNEYGNIESFTDGNGNVTNYQYNANGDRILITYPDLTTNSFTYDNVGNKKTYMDANGNITNYFYDAMNRLIQTQDAIGHSSYRTYDGKGNITSTTDELGHVTSYVYDALNRKTKIISPSGTILMTYDEKGNMLTKTDGNGNVTKYSYDTRNLLITETDALNHSRSFSYDNIGNKVTETDYSGNTKSYIYDALNRMTQMTDALTHTSSYIYDANGNRTSMTDANLNTTNYTYDELNRLIKTELPIGAFSFTFDDNGNRISMTDANGNITGYTFDNMNRQTDVTDAIGNTTHFEYDNQGNITETTDRNGHTSVNGYDALNRRINETNPLGEITVTNYNAVGNISSRSLPNGNTTNYTYDAANRMISSTDNTGLISTYTYDANSNRVIQTDGNGNTTINKYDALNRLIRVRDPMGRNTSYAYNNNSSLTSIQDRNNHATTYAYDILERKISTISPAGNTTTYTYDNVGNQTAITDDNGNTTSYTYDANNRLLTETYSNATVKIYGYDANGNLKKRLDNNGKVTNYKYDRLNRLEGRIYSSGVQDVFSYDNENNMITANNENANITFTYDDAYRKISENMNGKVTGYIYDIPGRKRTVNYPGGRTVIEDYDSRMRLTAVNSGIGVSYSYDAGNRMLSRSYSNGVTAGYSYNNNNWITSVSHVKLPTTIAQFNYTFDNEGNRLTSEKIHRPANSEKYTYDPDDRLINYKEGTLVGNNIPSPLTQTQFNYDGVGNRNNIVKDNDTTTYAYNNVNAYTNITDTVSVNPAYDANGNTLNDGRHAYGYDQENRLISADGGATASYKYDALGRRIQKVTASGTINYYYDDQRVIEERNVSDAAMATYVYGTWVDDILSMKRNDIDYFYHHNSLGSVIALTNIAGGIAERYEYDAYGNPTISYITSAGGSDRSPGNVYMFTGREYDKETKNYHYRARFYKPDWGRFGQWDPLGYVDGMNFFSYVKINPINGIDPHGLITISGGECCKNDDYKIYWQRVGFVSLTECFTDCVKNSTNPIIGYFIPPIVGKLPKTSPLLGEATALFAVFLGAVCLDACSFPICESPGEKKCECEIPWGGPSISEPNSQCYPNCSDINPDDCPCE